MHTFGKFLMVCGAGILAGAFVFIGLRLLAQLMTAIDTNDNVAVAAFAVLVVVAAVMLAGRK